MKRPYFLLLLMLVSVSAMSHAPGWLEYVNRTDQFIVNLPGKPQVRASVAHAAQGFRVRGGEVTYDAWADIGKIEGHQLQITNADQFRSFVAIHLHDSRLYILEARVPLESPPPGLFQQSLGILDDEGRRIRYQIDAEGRRTRMQVMHEWIGGVLRTPEDS